MELADLWVKIGKHMGEWLNLWVNAQLHYASKLATFNAFS